MHTSIIPHYETFPPAASSASPATDNRCDPTTTGGLSRVFASYHPGHRASKTGLKREPRSTDRLSNGHLPQLVTGWRCGPPPTCGSGPPFTKETFETEQA